MHQSPSLKKLLVLNALLLLFMFPTLLFAQDSVSSSLRVITFNIRYNNPNDGEHAWPNRKERVASLIRFHQADLIGMQEVLKNQINDLESLLPGYSWIGVGRDDGKDAGEFSPIFYRTDRFQLTDNGTFWLSETPDVIGSKSWDAAITRIANWAQFSDRNTSQTFLLLNTHFDHRGEQARSESAKLIVDHLQGLTAEYPIVVTGDFNVPPSSAAYATMLSYLKDSRLVSQIPAHGPEGTFAGFTVGSTANQDRIDYIFVDSSTSVLRQGTLTDQHNGNYPSDHLPVFAELLFSFTSE